jgi:hypothetical protein
MATHAPPSIAGTHVRGRWPLGDFWLVHRGVLVARAPAIALGGDRPDPQVPAQLPPATSTPASAPTLVGARGNERPS